MVGSGLQQRPVPLTGRERECVAVDRLLADAEAGAAGALVVRGEPGIGKSALLGYARQRAQSMVVLSAAGVQAESDLAFAGLHELLRPVTGYLGGLPDTQAGALSAALGLAPSAHADRLLISAAVLGLLAAAAEDHPVLCVIDDAQWVDRPSSDALVFSARRLRAERLAMLFGAREGEATRFEAAGVPEIKLIGLDQRSAAAILAVPARNAAPGVRYRLLAEADGNPLALLELATGLAEEQLNGRVPLPDAIPLTPRLEGVFRQRAGQLPQTAQTALLIAATDSTGDASAVLRAAATLHLPADALDPAQQAALTQITGSAIRFRHPLVRSALYQAATLSQRQRVHAALAGALSGEENTDRRIWHQAMATLTGDEEVAAALEASARRAQLRGGHASAAAAFLRAADLTMDEPRRAARLASAAQAAWDAGQPAQAQELAEHALPLADQSLRAPLLHLRGVIQSRCGNMRKAVTTLIEGAEASTDPSLTLEMLHEAAEAAADTGDLATVGELGTRAVELPAQTKRDQFSRLLMIGFAALFADGYERARAIFDDALDRAAELEDDPRAQIWAANAASGGSDLGAGLPFATRAVELARRQGLLSLLPAALEQQALELAWNSNFDQAYAAAQEGYLLSRDLGHGWGWHLATMAYVEAIWGREADTREHAAQVLALGQKSGETVLLTLARAALGLLELTAGRPADAATLLLEITVADRPDTHPIIAVTSVPDAVEAVVRAGRPPEVADAPLARFRAWADYAPTDARRSLLARCEALLGRRSPEQAFTSAIELAPALPPFQRARTELLYGEWLRRERRRTDARIHLRAALELFRRLGTVPWEERAEAELRATGETARKRDPATVSQLTPQELQIASLVAEGLTNRDIAAHLFLSPRTIDYHLRKVFTKLGIASRTELVRDGLPQPRPT
jgi:DNA-binding CsgD family transcriptional regulator